MNPIQRLFHSGGVRVGKWLVSLYVKLVESGYMGHVDGISVCEMYLARRTPSDFLQRTRDAMNLIREVDPRRHRRVCRYLRFIVNTELLSGGNFDWRAKMCNVDYTKWFATEYPQWNVRMYACLIVHEATHGIIHERGIRYNRQNRLQIERICQREEYRFARRLDPAFADECVGSFNAEKWKWYWEATLRERLIAWRKRIWAAYQARKS